MGSHIKPEGWHNWGSKDKEKTAYYAEYQSKGPGGDTSKRAAFGHVLTDISKYDIQKVLAGSDGWNPSVEGNALLTIKR
jgi:pectinesterase